MNRVNVGNCVVSHNISIPTKLSDYDYDPTRPNRRFISTYLHSLIFSDPVTDSDIIKISFESLTCTEIISNIYELMFNSYKNYPISIENIHLNNNINGIIILSKVNNILKFTICDFVTPAITIDIDDTDTFIQLLDINELDEMFVSYSNDRW